MAAYCESAAEAVASIEHEGAGAVERAGHHGRAGAVRDGQGLAGQGGLVQVHGDLPAVLGGGHGAVHGKHLGGTHQEPVAGTHLLHRHVLHGAVRTQAMRALRGAVQQGGQIPPSAAGRVVLEGLPTGEHQADEHGGEVLPHQHGGDDRGDGEDVHTPVPAHQVPDHAHRGPRGHHQGIRRGDPARRILRPRQVQAEGEGDDDQRREHPRVPRGEAEDGGT